MSKFTDLMAAYRELASDSVDKDAIRVYYRLHSQHLDASHFEDSYEGYFAFESDVDEYLMDTWYECNEVPDHIAGYVDDQAVLRDMRLDYSSEQSKRTGKVYLFHSC
jgi:antirestriction protein